MAEEKLALYVCRCLIILRNVLACPGHESAARGRRLQNFIVCHAEINNKTDFIFLPLPLSLYSTLSFSLYDLY